MNPLTDVQQLALTVLLGQEGWEVAARLFLEALSEKLEMVEATAVAAAPIVPAKNVITVPYERLRAVFVVDRELVINGNYTLDKSTLLESFNNWIELGDPLILAGVTMHLYEMPVGWVERVRAWKEEEARAEEERVKALTEQEGTLIPSTPDFSFRAPTQRIQDEPLQLDTDSDTADVTMDVLSATAPIHPGIQYLPPLEEDAPPP